MGWSWGGAADCGDSNRTNDRIWCGARDLNAGGRELPNLVAPAKGIDAEGYTGDGTSLAAPQVTGAAAQLMQRDSTLENWGEAVRAILMAGADEDVHGGRLSLTDGVDDRDGAGLLNVDRSLQIAASRTPPWTPGNWPVQQGFNYGTIYASTTPAGTWFSSMWKVPHVMTGGRLRGVLTWNASSTCTNPHLDTFSCLASQLQANLNLYVYRDSDGSLVGSSTSVADNYEVVEFATAPGEVYSIHIHVQSWSDTFTFFGIAWSQGQFNL